MPQFVGDPWNPLPQQREVPSRLYLTILNDVRGEFLPFISLSPPLRPQRDFVFPPLYLLLEPVRRGVESLGRHLATPLCSFFLVQSRCPSPVSFPSMLFSLVFFFVEFFSLNFTPNCLPLGRLHLLKINIGWSRARSVHFLGISSLPFFLVQPFLMHPSQWHTPQ